MPLLEEYAYQPNTAAIVESFDTVRDLPAREIPEGATGVGPVDWPAEAPGLRTALREFYARCDEVAVDVLNLTGTNTSLQDDECCVFQTDATGTSLNYKIIVRDAAVLAVLYQEDGSVRPSPFVEHRLPAAGSYVTLPDGSLGRLGSMRLL